MAIVLDGNLGITSPAETVQGALTTTGNTILGDAATDTLNVGNGGLVKDASGNVGIGTASPAGKLHVVGEITVQSSDYGRVGFTRGSTKIWTIGPRASDDYYVFREAGSGNVIFEGGNLLFNSGYGSAATAYGCRAWVNFNGTGTVAIRASGNVSSITDNGVGDYTVNFTTAMPDTNYCYVGSARRETTGFGALVFSVGGTTDTKTTSAAQVRTGSGTSAIDSPEVNISFFR